MKLLTLITLLLTSGNLYSNELESLLPSSHPTRGLTLNLLFSKLQESSRSWVRNGFYEEDGSCLYWVHKGTVETTTCLSTNGTEYSLSIYGKNVKEIFTFKFSRTVDFTIFDFLAFDVNLMKNILIKFTASRSGVLYEIKDNFLHVKTLQFGIYEFFSTLFPWGAGGVRQEVFGRCGTCSGKHYRAYISANGEVEYRASHLSGRVMPSSWNEYLGFSYFYVIASIGDRINVFD